MLDGGSGQRHFPMTSFIIPVDIFTAVFSCRATLHGIVRLGYYCMGPGATRYLSNHDAELLCLNELLSTLCEKRHDAAVVMDNLLH